MIHKVGGKGGAHEINGWEEPLTTLQQMPLRDFQHLLPLTSAKQQKEGTTGCTLAVAPAQIEQKVTAPNSHWHLLPLSTSKDRPLRKFF